MAVPEIPDRFYDLVLRYFDGDLDAAELDELNELLRSDGRLRDAFAALCVRTRMVREIGEPQRQAETRTADGSEGVITQLKLARDEARGRARGGMVRWVRAFAALAALALVSVGLFLGFSGETTDLPVDDRVSRPVAGKNHIARLVQVTPGGIGQFELAFALILMVNRLPVTEAITLAFLVSAVRYAAGLLLFGGTMLVFGTTTNFQQVRMLFGQPVRLKEE